MTGVIYFNVGTNHAIRLAVSLWSLRKVYRGPVCILNAGGDGGIIQQFAADERLSVVVHDIKIKPLHRNAAYVAKTTLYRHTPYDRSLYLDADTVVLKDPAELIETAGRLVVTQFSDWTCANRLVAGRCRQWNSVRHDGMDVPDMVQYVISKHYPAINTGVYVFDSDWQGMAEWEALAWSGQKCNFVDELAAQLLLPYFVDAIDCTIVDDRWNWSPQYGKADLTDVVVVHAHGNKSHWPQSLPTWWPIFCEAVEHDIGGIRNWLWKTGENRIHGYLRSVGFSL